MLVTGNETVMVQGITGKQGSFWTERMIECGTNVVAGAKPNKGGRTVAGIPVYDSVVEAAKSAPAGRGRAVRPAAGRQGCGTRRPPGRRSQSRVPHRARALPRRDVCPGRSTRPRGPGARPDTAGLVVPGEASVGIMPGFAKNIFQPGNIGVVSRSGSLGTLLALNLVTAGYGQSAFIGIGGDPIWVPPPWTRSAPSTPIPAQTR